MVKKTVYVKFVLENLKVIHKPLKQQFGKSMGVMDDEIAVTHWFSYSAPSGVTVDGEFIPFSAFRKNSNDYGHFNLKDAHFTWTQGISRYTDFNVSQDYLRIVPKNETPGYESNIYNITQIVGTETKRQAFDIVNSGQGELRGDFFTVGAIEWNPSYELKKYLVERDERNASETEYYTANGFTNKVKETSSNSSNNNQQSNTNNSYGNNTYNHKDWEQFNQMQQNVKNETQNWHNRIEQGEQLRIQKQEMYNREITTLANNIGAILEKVEQERQQREINKAARAIDIAVSNAFGSVKKEADYWSKFMDDLLNFANKYSKNLNKTAYDEMENSVNAIKRVLDEIENDHNYLQEKLRKDWDYADNDPRKFRVDYWEEYSYGKEPYINLSQTFIVGSRINDKNTRCNFVSGLLPLINKHAKTLQKYGRITEIEQAYNASGCRNYDYEQLLKSAKSIEAYEEKRKEKAKQIQVYVPDIG